MGPAVLHLLTAVAGVPGLLLLYLHASYCIQQRYPPASSAISHQEWYSFTSSVTTLCFLPTGKSLLWVAFLGMVILLIYAVLSFAFLWDRFYMSEDAVLYCDTLFQCFVSVIRYGLIDTLGLVCLIPDD